MKVPPGLESVLAVDPDVMWGAVCFKGTRVPLSLLLDCLASGVSLDEFHENYPSVARGQTAAVLEWQDQALRDAAGMLKAG